MTCALVLQNKYLIFSRFLLCHLGVPVVKEFEVLEFGS